MRWPALPLAMVLAACAGPRTDAPVAATAAVPSAWIGTAGVPGTAQAQIDARWWQAFGDPVLTQLVDDVLAGNTDLAIAATRVEQARAQMALVQGERMPSLSAAVSAARQGDVDAFGRARRQNAGQAELTLAYEVDLFGRLASADAAARASLLASQAAHDTVRLALAATTASSYISLRAQDARLEVLRATLDIRAASLKLAQQRVQSGYSPQLDLRQAEAEYSAAEQLIAATVTGIRRQENALGVLLGKPPQLMRRGADLEVLQLPPIAPGLPTELLRRRPDIYQAEQQLVAADHTLDSARAAFMPSFRIGLSGGYVDSNLLADPISIFSVGGSILAPLLDGGRLQAQADAATARRDEAAFAYKRATLVAWREVEDALAAEDGAARQESAILAQKQALAQAYALAGNRYRNGYSPYLEQLDAQRSLLSAELSLVQVKADRLSAGVSLYQALGGGWQVSSGAQRQ
ncbi:efflux transporter, outer membrane factor lipoprotein, NodT family [Herbaspirillum sp. CF444]|uniref:efflux transporter outer membrane subunit n=1 Tax=Herbaspirillum sp. CF444 TaxID=1144319 RepID=UPI0002724BC7|nr:efflux transporter outer membrane subunit [Herbaspirillum sp. CF444]EJL89753.1 efflux transporter, outer membrane factor lipoprotein, NodT family [Herbaspirillum sp. CF444]